MNTDMIWQTLSTSSADTERLGVLLGKSLAGGEVIELRADLGGGKTTFVRGLAKGLGSKTNVASPTFTLSRVYPAKDLSLYHYDFYRLDDPGILAEQLGESIKNSKAVVVIEWADIVNKVLPDDRITIELKPNAKSPDERDILISYPESKTKIIKQLETLWQESQP